MSLILVQLNGLCVGEFRHSFSFNLPFSVVGSTNVAFSQKVLAFGLKRLNSEFGIYYSKKLNVPVSLGSAWHCVKVLS